jgi:hypothetical protein
MGIYYECAIVHGRLLVWWHDLNGMPHSKWIEEPEVDEFLEKLNDRDFQTQRDLANLIKIRD